MAGCGELVGIGRRRPVAEPAALIGKVAQLGIGRSARAIPDHLAISGNDGAGPTLAHLQHAAQMNNSLALGGGPYHFLSEAPSAWRYRASIPLAASSVSGSRPLAPLPMHHELNQRSRNVLAI